MLQQTHGPKGERLRLRSRSMHAGSLRRTSPLEASSHVLQVNVSMDVPTLQCSLWQMAQEVHDVVAERQEQRIFPAVAEAIGSAVTADFLGPSSASCKSESSERLRRGPLQHWCLLHNQ